jgi:hypothetical protein
LIPWDTLLAGIKMEWELLSQKTSAGAHALRRRELPKTGQLINLFLVSG